MTDVLNAAPALPGSSPPVATPPEEERRRVARLFARAGFGASVDEIDRAAAKGYAAVVDELLDFAPAATRPDEATVLTLEAGAPAGESDGFSMVTYQRLVARPHVGHPFSARGEADPLLAQPLRHRLLQGPPAEGDGGPEPAAARPRRRQLPGPVQRRHRRPGHAHLARREHQPEDPAQRELRPRVPGAVHPGTGPLHPGRRTRGGAGLHRLHHRRPGQSLVPQGTPRRRREDNPRPDRPLGPGGGHHRRPRPPSRRPGRRPLRGGPPGRVPVQAGPGAGRRRRHGRRLPGLRLRHQGHGPGAAAATRVHGRSGPVDQDTGRVRGRARCACSTSPAPPPRRASRTATTSTRSCRPATP